MSNVIDIFPGRKEIEMKKFRENNFRPGLIDFKAIDPSKEIKHNNQNIEINYVNDLDADLASLAISLQNMEYNPRREKPYLTLYDRHGLLYELHLKGKSLNI